MKRVPSSCGFDNEVGVDVTNTITNIKTRIYIIPHIENVNPDGVKSVLYLSEISPVVIPPSGLALAR